MQGYIGIAEEDGYNNVLEAWSGFANWAGLGWSFNAVTFPNDFPSAIQDLMANVTISLIDLRNYPLDPSITSEFNISSPIIQTLVPATFTSYPAVYAYSHVALWQIYATSLGFTLICVTLGCLMLYRNGVAGELSFTQVLVTTRNPTLDKISEGAGLGGKYITDQVQKVKVRYGRLEGTDGIGFGMEDEIHSLVENSVIEKKTEAN